MKDKHVIEIIEKGPLTRLDQGELANIRAHTENCASCRRAYQVAQLSDTLVRERAAQIIQPSPFFQTRVMAALREQRARNDVPAFVRLWKSAGALAASMVAATALLATLSFLGPTQETVALNPYSAEAVVLDQELSDDPMSYEQVISTIYEEEDEAR